MIFPGVILVKSTPQWTTVIFSSGALSSLIKKFLLKTEIVICFFASVEQIVTAIENPDVRAVELVGGTGEKVAIPFQAENHAVEWTLRRSK